MPNIRKKQNHCLHMSRDSPPLVCLLRPVIANLCKTIPVAKEEGALERNILVRAQNKKASLAMASLLQTLPLIRPLNDGLITAPAPHHTQQGQMEPVCSRPTDVTGYASRLRKWTDIYKKIRKYNAKNHAPPPLSASANYG